MSKSGTRHKNYEILNLIGYGLAKFNNEFANEFGFKTKTDFYNYCVDLGIAETIGTVKNRMDLFDNFFPDNGRRGWWQKGDTYIHRKLLIDSLFGDETVKGFANLVKLRLSSSVLSETIFAENTILNPIVKSRFKQLQKTGIQAKMYFLHNYNTIDLFSNGIIEDARLYGDGYDFQVDVNKSCYLAEIKGIREKTGKFRLTENEYKKAEEYKEDYIITLVLNLNDVPFFKTIRNPIKNLRFEKREILSKAHIEYHLIHSM